MSTTSHPAPPVRMAVGACPRKAEGRNPAGVLTRYGDTAAVRLFDNGAGLTWVPTRPASSARVHVSWKTTAADITPARVRAALAGLQDGDGVEVWHETDVKHRKAVKASGQASADAQLLDWLAIKARFYEVVTALRESGEIPAVVVVNTLAWWSFTASVTNTGIYHAPADVLGVDLDGVENDRVPYLDYAADIPTVKAWADRWYGGRWAVPEFGLDRATVDVDGTRRAEWLTDQAARCQTAGAEWLCYFDQDWYNNGRGELDKPAEVDALRRLVTG